MVGGGRGVEPILNCDVAASGQFSFRPCIRVSGDCDLCGEKCGLVQTHTAFGILLDNYGSDYEKGTFR